MYIEPFLSSEHVIRHQFLLLKCLIVKTPFWKIGVPGFREIGVPGFRCPSLKNSDELYDVSALT